MRRATLLLFALLVPLRVLAASGSALALEPAGNDVGDIASLQRGAKYFVNYCFGCHAAKYVRYNRLATDLQLTEDQVKQNLMFTGEKLHETMSIAMSNADGQRWFGQAPPDLSLMARSKGPDYLYNFLRSFYVDDSRSIGSNNLLLDGASMPNILWELQGLQRAVFEDKVDDSGVSRPVFVGFETLSPGVISAEEFDQVLRDLVNFLEYIGEPVQLQRRALGFKVLLFLLLLFLFSYLLKREIWKDVD